MLAVHSLPTTFKRTNRRLPGVSSLVGSRGSVPNVLSACKTFDDADAIVQSMAATDEPTWETNEDAEESIDPLSAILEIEDAIASLHERLGPGGVYGASPFRSDVKDRRRESQLNARLDAWMNHTGNAREITAIVVAANVRVASELTELLHEAAASNVPFGLAAIPLKVRRAHDSVEISAALQLGQRPTAFVLVSEAMLNTEWLQLIRRSDGKRLQTTHFIVVSETSTSAFSKAALQSFGAHDVLCYPCTLESLRTTLHRWMPRTWLHSPLPSPMLSSRCVAFRGHKASLSPRMSVNGELRLSPCSSPSSSPRSSPRKPSGGAPLRSAVGVMRILIVSHCPLSAAILEECTRGEARNARRAPRSARSPLAQRTATGRHRTPLSNHRVV